MRVAVVRIPDPLSDVPGKPLDDRDAIAVAAAGFQLSGCFAPRFVVMGFGPGSTDTWSRLLDWLGDVPRWGRGVVPKSVEDAPRAILGWARALGGKAPSLATEGDILVLVDGEGWAALSSPLAAAAVSEAAAACFVAEYSASGWQSRVISLGGGVNFRANCGPSERRTLRTPEQGRPVGNGAPDREWSMYLPRRNDLLCTLDFPLLDGHGYRLPGRPLAGMTIDVNWADHTCLFSRWEVVQVSNERFIVEDSLDKRWEWPLSDWDAWLRRRTEEGVVSVQLPGCPQGWCAGCDGGVVGAQQYEGEEAAIAKARVVARKGVK